MAAGNGGSDGRVEDTLSQSSLSVCQWNLGHPLKHVAADASAWAKWNDFIDSQLADGTVDFCNVVNFPDLKVPSHYKKITADCSTSDAHGDVQLDMTSLLYNASRWEVVGNVETAALLPKASAGKRGPLVLAKFESKTDSREVVVVGTHFPPFVYGCDCCASSSEKSLQQKLIPYSEDNVVFLADTNALFQDNRGIFQSLGLEMGANTPTNQQTLRTSCLKYLCFFKPDRIITTLEGPDTPVTVLDLPDPAIHDMHNPIAVTLGN